ncbi:hypothetical protein [Micromonospora tulbaghiae]|uniref:hypothetical protein n=1 Tax=Micromonospora tulbaghiae TaxID=479978 RepID=UPI003EB8C764
MVFAAGNQGVWVALIDPTDDDPVVWYDGGPERLRERERLSGFLLQFALNEAVNTSPFTGFATVTMEALDRFVVDLVPVPLQPMRVPGDPTRHWVAPGLVAMAADYGESGIWLSVGSRQRSALRPRSPRVGTVQRLSHQHLQVRDRLLSSREAATPSLLVDLFGDRVGGVAV